MPIPKIIHYCWLSEEPFPDDIQRCIDSWHVYMPDYEFRLWDRNRFDCDSVPYVKQAMQLKKYAFASDYIRLYALYYEGGIYLDSDIEAYRSFDPLLIEPAFTGFEVGGRVAAWIFGSTSGNSAIGELLHYYDGRFFCDSTSKPDLTPNTIPVTGTLVKRGLQGKNQTQKLDDITVFSSDFFCPLNPWTGKEKRTSDTYAKHLFKGAWMDDGEEIRFMQKYEIYVDEYVEKEFPRKMGKVIIYGAGILGHLVFDYLREKYPEISVAAFMVTKRDFLWRSIEGIPLIEAAEWKNTDNEIPVIVSTIPRHHKKIMEDLEKLGISRLSCLGTII